MKKFLIALAVIVIIGVGVGIGVRMANNNSDNNASNQPASTNQTPTPAPSTSSQTAAKSGKIAISIKDMAFDTPTITVKKGSTITWTNNDSVTHTVTSDATSDQQGLHSPDLAPGATYSFTFKTVGTYTYHCSIHPSMMGSVEVVN